MKTHPMRLALATALLGTVALAGCKRDADTTTTTTTPPPASTTTAPATAPAATPAAGLTVSTVDLGNAVGADNRVTTPMTSFGTRDTIHASVVTDGQAGGNLTARWTFQDGQVVHSEDKYVGPGPQVTEFRITNPDGWPAGSYTLQVSMDGNVLQTRELTIR